MQYSECYEAIAWLSYRLAHCTWLQTGSAVDGQAARIAFEIWAEAFGVKPGQVPEPSHKWEKVP